MADFDLQTLEHLKKLCRIECTKDEKKALQADLSKILKYVEELDEVDTNGIEPCYRVLQTLKNVMREDAVGETLDRALFLANAPSYVGGLIRVPPVMKSNS